MAMSSLIRKITCQTIVPLSLRAIATPRRNILTGPVTKSLISGEKHRIVHRESFFINSNQYFSTLRDVQKLVADFKDRFDRKVSVLLKYEIISDKRLKPAIQVSQVLYGKLRDVQKLASYFMRRFDRELSELLKYEIISDEWLKPAILQVSQVLYGTLRDVQKLASYFMRRFHRKVSDFLNWESEADRRLKPAIHLPQPPVDFAFKIHDTLGEGSIRLTRELRRENILIEALCKVDVHQSTDSSFFRNFLPTDYSAYKDFRELHISFSVTKMESNAPGVIYDGTQIHLIFSGNRVKFSKRMDCDAMKYWGEVFPILGFDEALLRFLIVYMVRRNKLNRLPRLNNLRASLSVGK